MRGIQGIQGTSYLFFFPLPSRLEWVEWVKNPAKHTLQPGKKPRLTQRPAGALMPTYQNHLTGLRVRPCINVPLHPFLSPRSLFLAGESPH
jgi:hypothetical protein